MNSYFRIGCLLCLTALTGCASNAGYQSRLDNTSGVTVSNLPKPVTLARAAPRLSFNARDYMYLGPVEINRMGNKEFYLWIGLGSTIDRQPLGEQPLVPTDLLMVADGIPMRLNLEDWQAGTMGATPYDARPAPYRSFQARIAKQQLNLLSSAHVVEIYLASDSGPAARYRPWSGSLAAWSEGTREMAAARQ